MPLAGIRTRNLNKTHALECAAIRIGREIISKQLMEWMKLNFAL